MAIVDTIKDYLRIPTIRTAEPEITPYPALRSRLSQVWINRWTVLLFLVLVRTLLAISDIDDGIGDAKREALSACTGVESMGTAMASMPHYLAQGINELTASGVEKAVDGLMSMLTLTVTGVEQIVLFVINLMTSTYLCLITLVVAGSLHVALQVVEDAANFLNKTLGAIGSDIHHGIDDFEGDLNKFVSGLNKIGSVFGGHSTIPKLNIDSSLDSLDHLQLPSSLDEGLTKLNNSIPNFGQVHNFTNSVIEFPFEEIKQLISNHTGNYTFDRSVFPVPAKEQMTFCNDNDGISGFFHGLSELAGLARRVSIAVLVILAVLVCIPMAYREVWRWKSTQTRAQLIGQYAHDPIDVIYIASRPYTASAGIKAGSYTSSIRRQTLIRWIVAYATTTPAIFVLSLGIAGFFACLCHYILLKTIEKEVPALAHEVGAFAGLVVHSLENASAHWAVEANSIVLDMNNRINHDVFGWVNTSTSAVNSTLNTFIHETTTVLNDTFGGTVLYGPVTEVFNCLIGLKVAGVEQGLTWVHDHAHIDFPLLPNNTFSLGAASSIAHDSGTSSFLANPNSDATSEVTAAVDRLTDKIMRSIIKELIVSGSLVAVYLLVVLIGIVRALYLNFSEKGTHSRPGLIFHGHQQASTDPFDEKTAAIPLASMTPVGNEHVVPITAAPPYSAAGEKGATVERNNSGSTLGGESYILQPRAFPTFPAGVVSRDDAVTVSPEKLGYAGERTVGLATTRPGFARVSSYGDLNRAASRKDDAAGAKAADGNVTFDGLGH
ncbi:MAG: plasma membrane fusion protein prm1 [Chrysothrix sp. TS-e1954]|nr:MAG: plasma membrane fusion protein prm1 [Chrysothrix sp. TS-e1954]